MSVPVQSSWRFILSGLAIFALGCSRPASSATDARTSDHARAVDELASAAQVLAEMNQVAKRHRERARCVAVIPSLVRAGFILGGRRGDGVVSCRTSSGWSAPAFITVTGGSAGFLLGLESSDVVMLVMTERAKAQLFRSSFAIGADASASAGPVGQAAQVATDATMTSEILSYAHSRGLFVGAELSGDVIKQDVEALIATYGATPDVHAILAGDVAGPHEGAALVAQLFNEFPSASAGHPE